MKRILLILICVVILSGCSSAQKQADKAMLLRTQLLDGNGCSFQAVVTADYGDELYEFTMQCEFDKNGNMKFTVLEPESICGISGKIDADGGALTFDDKVLAFEMLADDQITPVSAPWVMIKAVRSGYISSCGKDKNGYQIQIDDSYKEDALQIDLWTNFHSEILRAEFLWGGRRVISVHVTEYVIL